MEEKLQQDSPVSNGFEDCLGKTSNSNSNPLHVHLVPVKRTRWQRLKWWFSFTKAKQELCDPLFWHDVIVETVLCIFYNAMVVWVGITLIEDIYRPNVLHFGLLAGFFIFLCIEGWGPICGASINVARTLSVFICGRYSPTRSLIYFLVEVGGGAAGAVLAKSMTPSMYHDRFKPILPAEGMSWFQVCFMEGILTANLIVVGLVVADPKLKPNSVMGSFPIGFTVATGIMAAGTHTGGLQNPVVALIYAMNSNNFTDHWMYWVGPLVGSTIASLFYITLEQIRERFGPYSQPQVHENPHHHDGEVTEWCKDGNNNNSESSSEGLTRRRVFTTSAA